MDKITYKKTKQEQKQKRAIEDLYISDDLPTSDSGVSFESYRRDIYYSAMIKDIVMNNRTTQTLKKWFFIVVCFVFVAISIGGIVVVITISRKAEIKIEDIGVAIAGLGSVISSVIALPTIVAKHLFPEDFEKSRFDFMNEVQKMDSELIPDSGEYNVVYNNYYNSENGNSEEINDNSCLEELDAEDDNEKEQSLL